MARTKRCDENTRRGRLTKAVSFLDQAEIVLLLADDESAVTDAAVTLFVHAGIAAADVICCAHLAEHALGESHSDAIALLRTVNVGAAKHLSVLLGLKTRAGYSAERTSPQNVTRARRAAAHLVDAARQVG